MKIAVLISGGVDSAVAVEKLMAMGHDLHLFYIRIGLDTDEGDCSAEEDIEMCSFIARRYGLPMSSHFIRSTGTMSWNMLYEQCGRG